MMKELLMQILLIKALQSISAKMYDVFFTKILQGRHAEGVLEGGLRKRCSRICG